MTKPYVIDHSETVSVKDISVLIEGCARNVTFIQGGRDAIEVSATAGRAHVNLVQTVGATIVDETSGLRVTLDPYSIGTTFQNIQNDPRAKIDLIKSPFQNLDDLASHLKVTPEGTTLLSTIPHGPPIAFFQGDLNVSPSMFRLHC